MWTFSPDSYPPPELLKILFLAEFEPEHVCMAYVVELLVSKRQLEGDMSTVRMFSCAAMATCMHTCSTAVTPCIVFIAIQLYNMLKSSFEMVTEQKTIKQ